MTSFKDARNLLLESYNAGIIVNDEFILLYEGNFLKNPEFPHEYNEIFGLDERWKYSRSQNSLNGLL